MTAAHLAPECRIVPFVPGRRPTDEAAHPSLGSSDQAALLLGDDARENAAYVLFDVRGAGEGAELDATVRLTGHDGSIDSGPVADWDRRPVPAMAFEVAGGEPVLAKAELGQHAEQRLALALQPDRDLGAGDGRFGFDQLFAQQVRVTLRVTDGGEPVAEAHGDLLACDTRRLGSLYERLIERLVAADTARQAEAAGVADPGAASHPWYPVLLIGGDKAALYEQALVGDIVGKRRNLTDPGWLLRIGLYLEFLTCLGVMEAVKEEVGDLLTPDERHAFETSPLFAEIRDRIDPAAWRKVWELREIAFARRGAPRTGPVSARNLLRKQRATLAFLEAHHDDLKHAIGLAGPNPHNAQETWQRVFRDAERAVLRSTPAAFPELAFLPGPVRELVLWHRRGQLGHGRAPRIPGAVAALLGDRDGLFASACTQYRASMNAVAAWSKARLLMDYTGAQSIPPEVSLLETAISRPTQVALLQRRDGYEERLDVLVELPEAAARCVAEAQRLLAGLELFAGVADDELLELARTARPLALGPHERVIVQGLRGTSMFAVVDGEVEVLVRGDDGHDRRVATLGAGSLVGEISVLTGEPRTATVRAITGATLYELGPRQYERLVRSRPQLRDDLAALAATRLHHERVTPGARATPPKG